MPRSSLPFSKMHGLGNDFVMIDARTTGAPAREEDLASLARAMCDRHLGIGADGLVLMLDSDTADVRMRVFNPDGSEAEMCGNGIRCLAGFARARGAAHRDEMRVETRAGVLTPRLVDEASVEVDMGAPILESHRIPAHIPGVGNEDAVIDRPLDVDGETFAVCCVSMGNPHCTLFLDAQESPALRGVSLDAVPLGQLGSRIQRHPAFPAGVNVGVAVRTGERSLSVRVWERGAGATRACGTGACATLVAAVLSGRMGPNAEVTLPGGVLEIAWQPGETVRMRGPYAWVYDGVWPAS